MTENLYGYCGSKCKHEVYSKQEIDDKFTVAAGNITMTNGSGSTNISYPNGFNKDNCVVISAETKYSGNGVWAFGAGVADSFTISGQLFTSYIHFVTNSEDNVGPTGTYECRVVLMKISQ